MATKMDAVGIALAPHLTQAIWRVTLRRTQLEDVGTVSGLRGTRRVSREMAPA